MTRLPRIVVCCVPSCGRQVPVQEAKREVVVWCDPKGGGTLSGVSDMRQTGRWRCLRCIHGREEPQAYESTEEAKARARAALGEKPRQEAML